MGNKNFMPLPQDSSTISYSNKAKTRATNINGQLDEDRIKTLYDTKRKSMNDFVKIYANVANNDYYGKVSGKLDYRHKLMDLYQYVMLDTHLSSIIDSLFHQIVGERYTLNNPDGSINKEATKLIKKSWFVDYIRGVLEAKAFGYTLMQLGELDKETGSLDEVVQISRHNVCPNNSFVLEWIHGVAGWDITDSEHKLDHVLVDGKEGFGWLLKCVPMIISKRFALSSHTQYAETYGIPLIIGKTTDDSFTEKQNLANEIAAARDTRVIVTGTEDEINFLNQISNDTNKIYTELVRLTNDEVTMLILGQSATTESQAYVGSAEIQYRVMVDRVQAIREYVTNHINEELMWRLVEKGMDVDGLEFTYSNAMELSPKETTDMLRVMLQSYEISPEEIEEMTGIKVGRQFMEEANDQLLTYGEESVKERGNPDNAKSKDPEGTTTGKAREKETQDKVESVVANFLHTSHGAELDTMASAIEIELRKLDSKTLSNNKMINGITETYKQFSGNLNNIEASISEEEDEFFELLIPYLGEIYRGGDVVVSEEMISKQIEISKRIFKESYKVDLDNIDSDSNDFEYYSKVINFISSFAGVKQYQLMQSVIDISLKPQTFENFTAEAKKANRLFNNTYNKVESGLFEVSYEGANTWRSSNDDDILEYATVGDNRVRHNHSILDGVRMRKSDWAGSNFVPPWEHGCRCILININSKNGQLLTKSRNIPNDNIVAKEFRTNSGETGAVFTGDHPYFQVSTSDSAAIGIAIANANDSQ